MIIKACQSEVPKRRLASWGQRLSKAKRVRLIFAGSVLLLLALVLPVAGADPATGLAELRRLFQGGELKKVEEVGVKLAAEYPRDGAILRVMIVLYVATSRPAEAEAMLEKARLLDPQGQAYRENRAALSMLKAISPKPDSLDVRLNLEWPEKQLQMLEKIVKEYPDYTDACFNLAVCYAIARPPNKERARQFYARSLKLGAEPDESLEKMIDWKAAAPEGSTPAPVKK